MVTSMMGVPDTIGLQLPTEWEELPVDDPGYRERWKELQALLRERPEWRRTEERQLELFMYQLKALLNEERVRFIATFVALRPAEEEEGEVEGDAGTDNAHQRTEESSMDDSDTAESDDRDGGHGREQGDIDVEPLFAGCLISVHSRQDLGTDLPLTTDALIMAYSMEDEDADTGAVSMTDLEPASKVGLALVGESVRLVRLLEIRHENQEPERLFMESFLVPLAAGEALCTLQFVTPNVKDAPDFSVLFNSIAQTLRLFDEDTPTLEPEPVE